MDFCFICEGLETPAQRMVKVTPKDYLTLLAYAEAVKSATILEHLKESWHAGRLRYHFECKCDLYNKSVKVTLKLTCKCRVCLPKAFHVKIRCSRGRERISTDEETAHFIRV